MRPDDIEDMRNTFPGVTIDDIDKMSSTTEISKDDEETMKRDFRHVEKDFE